MKREIKFRAWDIKANIFIAQGDIIDLYYSANCNSFKFDNDDYDLNGRSLIFLQYTGLKDKNGVEIYDGDVVELKNRSYNFGDVGKVEWNEDYAGWMVTKGVYSKNQNFSLLNCDIASECEVIGNIHSNPELL